MSSRRLVVVRGGQWLSEHPLPPGSELVVGRSEGCEVVVADGSVSRMHARFTADDEGVWVEDLGSANGTFVDEVRLQGRVRLAAGQQVRVAQRAQSAPVLLRFEGSTGPVMVPPPTLPSVDIGDRTVATSMARPGPSSDEIGDSTPPERPTAASPPASAPPASATPRPASGLTPLPPSSRPLPPGEPAARLGAPLAPDPPAQVPSSPRRKRRGVVLALAIAGLAVAIVVGLTGGWLLLRWFPMHGNDASKQPSTTPAPPTQAAAEGTTDPDLPSTAPAPSAPAPTSGDGADATAPVADPTPESIVEPTPTSPPTRADLGGKWTARLENLFYPEEQYVVSLDLELVHRGGQLGGSGQAAIAGPSMTFSVPRAVATGTVRAGAPPKVSIHLPFGRPIGDLRLEGVFENGALAGTYRSSVLATPGTWVATRAPD